MPDCDGLWNSHKHTLRQMGTFLSSFAAHRPKNRRWPGMPCKASRRQKQEVIALCGPRGLRTKHLAPRTGVTCGSRMEQLTFYDIQRESTSKRKPNKQSKKHMEDDYAWHKLLRFIDSALCDKGDFCNVLELVGILHWIVVLWTRSLPGLNCCQSAASRAPTTSSEGICFLL